MNTFTIILVIVVLYPYVLYPVLLYFVSVIKLKYRRPESDEIPMVCIIVPVYNGASLISNKVQNLKLLSYPHEKLEIIFVSDGSTDDTNKILQSIDGIKVVALDVRVGKERAIKDALKHTTANLICLTDVGVSINSEGISNMVVHFSDNQVGAVSSVDRTDFKSYVLETFHVAFENKIRLLEASVSSSVGASGSFFMTRKHYLEKLPYTCCSDLAIALECVKDNTRVAVEPHACGFYGKSIGVSNELSRKVRTITHGMNTLFSYRELLNPVKYGLFSWQLASHKLLRWVSPVALALLLLTMVTNFIFTAAEWELIAVSVGILLVLLVRPLRKKIKTNMALFGVYVVAMFLAIANVLSKNKNVLWEPTQRSDQK
jgi:cellulose synthase/poly-beta-1,6-N-acetylglucosamine synthase-like glycosyltransferase